MSVSRTTIKTVAERAQVSVATVSRVLNGNKNVRPELRLAVEQAARELSYVPTKSSQPKKAKLLKIGLLFPTVSDSFYPSVIDGIMDTVLGKSVETILCDFRGEQKWENHYIRMLEDQGVDGIITTSRSYRINPLLEKHIEAALPLVFLLDREVERADINIVSTDNVEGAYHAAKYLLDLGHRDLLCLCPPDNSSVSAWRRRGVLNAFANYGLQVNSEYFHVCEKGFVDAYNKVKRMKEHNLDFTAICALSDTAAFGAWRAMEDLGYRIPDDCSIVGYDDLEFSSLLSLTTVAEPRFEIGKNAAWLLLDLVQGRRDPPQRIIIRNTLIIRNSCMKL